MIEDERRAADMGHAMQARGSVAGRVGPRRPEVDFRQASSGNELTKIRGLQGCQSERRNGLHSTLHGFGF